MGTIPPAAPAPICMADSESELPNLSDILFEVCGIEEQDENLRHSEECLRWLQQICDDDRSTFDGLAHTLPKLREDVAKSCLSGELIMQALNSTRELIETFGLLNIKSRLRFEELAVAKFRQTSKQSLTGTAGRIYNAQFLNAVQPLYDMHMGVENMGPLLYNLVRFTKPLHVLEIGAGYTTVFLLQALRDNYEEMKLYKQMKTAGTAHINGTPWCVDKYLLDNGDRRGVCHTVDNMAHAHTTAHKVVEIATQLDLSEFLRLHEDDAYTFSEILVTMPNVMLDMVWIDLGAAHRMRHVFKEYWPFVNPSGGLVCVHSTLTNLLTRRWLEDMRSYASSNFQSVGGNTPADDVTARDRSEDLKFFRSTGTFHQISFMEPHKLFQNSVSIFQKRAEGYQEQVFTNYP